MDAAEDDEICNGDEVLDEWLSSCNPETHMNQKMATEERLKRTKVCRVVTRESMKRDEEKTCSRPWVVHQPERAVHRRLHCANSTRDAANASTQAVPSILDHRRSQIRAVVRHIVRDVSCLGA